jgi:hypothetical protein
MITTRREYTAQDIEQVNQAEAQLRAKGLDEQDQRIVDIVDAFFQANRGIPVTVAVIVKAIEAQPGLKWLSHANLEYNRVAAENPVAAQQLADWMAKQGKPGTPVNQQGDQFFQNMSLLLTTLRGYDINPKTIQNAENRIANKAGRKLHYVQAPRREMGTITEAAKADDGAPFLGRNLNEPEWVKRSRERNERDAKEAANQPSSTSLRAIAAREAQRKSEELRGNTHAESEQIGRVFVTAGTEIDWPATLQERLKLQQSFNRAQQVRRFVR